MTAPRNALPIVFSHANSFPASTYRVLFRHLKARGFEISAVERYGHDPRYPVTNNWPHLVQQLADFAAEQVRRRGERVFLVGHSLGGLYMQLFARQYPREVAALVLVDSTHPDQVKGAGNPEQWPVWLKVLFRATASTTARQELAALDATGDQVSSLPVDSTVPVWVLSALRATGAPSVLADDAAQKRADIAQLYPGSIQVWVDSGHGIPLEKPEAVVLAIQEALRVARSSRTGTPKPQ